MQRFILLFSLLCLLIIGCGVDEKDKAIVTSVQICMCLEDRDKYFCVKTQEKDIIKKIEKLDKYLKKNQGNKGESSIIIKYVMSDNSIVVNKYENIHVSEKKVIDMLNIIKELEPAEHPFFLERKEKRL